MMRANSRMAGPTGEALAADALASHARRAGLLSKCDLLTEMVGEFPELQGRMGCEYARRDGEPEAVAAAIGEVYMPRFADDAIPATPAGRAVATADKLDTLAGIFGIGQAPSGDKDPYALRRAALGVLRIIIEAGLDPRSRRDDSKPRSRATPGRFPGCKAARWRPGRGPAESAGGQATETHEGTARDTGSDNGTTTGQALSAQGSMAESESGAAEPAGRADARSARRCGAGGSSRSLDGPDRHPPARRRSGGAPVHDRAAARLVRGPLDPRRRLQRRTCEGSGASARLRASGARRRGVPRPSPRRQASPPPTSASATSCARRSRLGSASPRSGPPLSRGGAGSPSGLRPPLFPLPRE